MSFESYLPEHKCGMYLKHNEHLDCYESLEEWMSYMDIVEGELSEEDRAICIATNECWMLQWYPDNPVASFTVYGPTLERVIELAKGVMHGKI